MAHKKLPKKVLAEIRQYKKILKADKLPITGVYVFGSYAKGVQRIWSDIDVCVVSPKFKDAWRALTYLTKKVPYGFGWSIEPVGFSPKDFKNKYSSLIQEIKKYGVRV